MLYTEDHFPYFNQLHYWSNDLFEDEETAYWDDLSWPRAHVGCMRGMSRYCKTSKVYYKQRGNRVGRRTSRAALAGNPSKMNSRRPITGWDII